MAENGKKETSKELTTDLKKIDTSKLTKEEMIELVLEETRQVTKAVEKAMNDLTEEQRAEVQKVLEKQAEEKKEEVKEEVKEEPKKAEPKKGGAKKSEEKNKNNEKEPIKAEEKKKESKNQEMGIPDKFYMPSGNKMDEPRSIYSILNIQNRNSDVRKFTKNTVSTILRRIYSPSELEERINKTNSLNFDDFSRKVLKAYKKEESDVLLCSISDNVKKYKENEMQMWEKEKKNNNIIEIGGPQALVFDSILSYGRNVYYNAHKEREKRTGIKYEIKPLSMLTLVAKFPDDKKAEEKITEIKSYVKDTYGYDIQYEAKGNRFKKNTLVLEKSTKQMDKAVDMLYEVSKTLTGSKKVKYSMAKSMVDLDNVFNTYLNSSNIFENIKKRKLFKQHADDIKDVVTTISTIFMSRFVFEAPQFGEIERDLTQQAMFKLRNIQFNSDRNEDYWVNELIQDRVKVNIDQILAQNKITDVKQLVDIYNRNGTVIENPEKINCIDDLIFTDQYNVSNFVNNKLPQDVKENIFGLSKPVLKNEETLVKQPEKNEDDKLTQKQEEIVEKYREDKRLNKIVNNKYIEELRNTDEYKKYYEYYKNLYKDMTFKLSDEEINEVTEQIRKSLTKNEELLLALKNSNNTNKAVEDELVRASAQKAVMSEKVENKTQENSNGKDENQGSKSDEKESKTLKLVESFKVNDGKDKDALLGQESIDFDALEAKKANIEEENAKKVEKTVEGFIVNEDENANVLLGQESVDFDELARIAAEEKEKEDKKETVVFRTEKSVKNLSSEELAKKVRKFYSEMINGSNGKVGVIGENLNYRRVEDENSANNSSDSKRLDDKELKKANRIRAEKIEEVIEALTNSTLDYFENNEENLDGTRIPKLCAENIKARFNIDSNKRFTKSDLKKCISVMITKLVNEELKDADIELYTGKNTYKKYCEKAEEFLGGE